MMVTHLCPVCHREAKPSVHKNIPRHFDSRRIDICPGGGEPFYITVEIDITPELMAVAA